MKIIFLDIDGVICTFRSHFGVGDFGFTKKLDPIALGLIDRLLEVENDTHLVICSSWRVINSQEELLEKFRAEGFAGKFHEDWRTPSIYTKGKIRGDEIDAWLSKHPEVTNYICIDDESDFHEHHPFVKTSPYDGILYKDWLLANKLLYGNEEAWFEMKRNKQAESKVVEIPIANIIGSRPVDAPRAACKL